MNGLRTTGMIIIKGRQMTETPGLIHQVAPTVWFAAVAGATLRRAAGRLTGATTGPAAATASLDFVLPGQFSPWLFGPCTLGGFFWILTIRNVWTRCTCPCRQGKLAEWRERSAAEAKPAVEERPERSGSSRKGKFLFGLRVSICTVGSVPRTDFARMHTWVLLVPIKPVWETGTTFLVCERVKKIGENNLQTIELVSQTVGIRCYVPLYVGS